MITTGGGVAATAGTTRAAARHRSRWPTLTSSFPLQSGYAVQLQTLPAKSSASAVTKAEHAAAAKGATHIGVILQRDFHVTPAPPSGRLRHLLGRLQDAGGRRHGADEASGQVPSGQGHPGRSPSSGSVAGARGRSLAKTNYGSAHEVTGFKPGQAQLNAGAKAVQKIQQGAGKGYVDSQRGLPDQISVP